MQCQYRPTAPCRPSHHPQTGLNKQHKEASLTSYWRRAEQFCSASSSLALSNDHMAYALLFIHLEFLTAAGLSYYTLTLYISVWERNNMFLLIQAVTQHFVTLQIHFMSGTRDNGKVVQCSVKTLTAPYRFSTKNHISLKSCVLNCSAIL